MLDALISLKPRHMSNLIDGIKTVELRSRVVNLQSGTRVWLYSTLPDGYIGAYALVENVEIAKPTKIWKVHGKEIAISKREFNEYTEGKQFVSAIKFSSIYTIEPGIHLDYIRRKSKNFQPPQFMKWLQNDYSLLKYLNRFVERNTTSVSLAW